MGKRPGPGSYAAWWLLSYAVPIAVAWPLWYASHGLSLAVLVVLTLVILAARPGRGAGGSRAAAVSGPLRGRKGGSCP